MGKISERDRWLYTALLIGIGSVPAKAQFTVAGQLRTRTEFRNGFGTLRPKGNAPAVFTSQRTRLAISFKNNRVLFHTALQDVRVWGQDAGTISNLDGNKLGVHEAWAELMLANKKDSSFTSSPVDRFAIRIGRQELVYDDSRLLGNLDWLQQARRHDAVVFKLLQAGFQVDAGLAFNQHTDAVNYNGTYYTPANVLPYVKDSRGNLTTTPAGMIPLSNAAGWSTKTGTPAVQSMPSTNGLYQDYKALQFLYVAKKLGNTRVSGLLLADHFGRYKTDSVRNIAGADTGYVYGRRFNEKGVNSRVTTGLLVNSSAGNSQQWQLQAGFYYQFGKDRDARPLSAYTSTLAISRQEKRSSYTLGWDLVSGDNARKPSAASRRFDPLYGTPHKFWGYMDYFYVATGAPAGGISNAYARYRYAPVGKRFTAALDYHYFRLASAQQAANGAAIPQYLGSEFDLVLTYTLNPITNIELGSSVLLASRSMEYAKNAAPNTTHRTASWAYLMVSIKPSYTFQ